MTIFTRGFRIVPIAFSLISFILAGCGKKDFLTKTEIYDILNQIIVDDSLSMYIICSKADFISPKKEFGFDAKDIEFIKGSSQKLTGFQYRSGQLKTYSRRNRMFELAEIDTSCNTGLVYHLSFPLISRDRKRVVIERNEDCNCMLGGQGGFDLYIKVNGRWKRENSFNRWIS